MHAYEKKILKDRKKLNSRQLKYLEKKYNIIIVPKLEKQADEYKVTGYVNNNYTQFGYFKCLDDIDKFFKNIS